MSDNKVLLSVNNLSVKYVTKEKTVNAVNDVSFVLKVGKTLGLVGETGAGKTTIARSILRVLQTPPAVIENGEIIFDGEDILEISEKEMQNIRGNMITMIFQDPMTSLNPVMTVGEQIAEVIRLHEKITKHEAKPRANEMLEMVGIPAERFGEYPHQFSGGMKQRVVIAIALACRPQLLLADEPTTALDVTIQAQILDLMKKLNEVQQTSTILITHDLGVVAEMCDDVAVVYAGQIVEQGTLADVFNNPSHPYTQGLFGAIPDIEEDRERLIPIDGMPPDPAALPSGCYFNPRCPRATEACRQGNIPMVEISEGHFCRCLTIKEEK